MGDALRGRDTKHACRMLGKSDLPGLVKHFIERDHGVRRVDLVPVPELSFIPVLPLLRKKTMGGIHFLPSFHFLRHFHFPTMRKSFFRHVFSFTIGEIAHCDLAMNTVALMALSRSRA